jgi:hypothetical protein
MGLARSQMAIPLVTMGFLSAISPIKLAKSQISCSFKPLFYLLHQSTKLGRDEYATRLLRLGVQFYFILLYSIFELTERRPSISSFQLNHLMRL